MAKTNFTKVEDILNQGLEDLTVNELLILADKAAGMGDSEQAKAARARVAKARQEKERAHWISSIKRDLEFLRKRDKAVLKDFKLKRAELLKLLNHPDQIDTKGWKFIQSLYDKLSKYKAEHFQETESDEEVVESERLKHINKRFNVNDKWLPLQ